MATDLLNSGASWLAGRLQTHAARPVTYRRGNASVAINATKGATTRYETDDTGITQRVVMVDWIVQTSDLLGAGLGNPEQGDRIVDAAGADGSELYEVLPLSGEPSWRRLDPGGCLLRVHTKRIAVE